MDGHHLPDRISYYLLGGGAVRRAKVGLDLDLVATKHWLAPAIRLLRVPPLLNKTCCRECEVQFQAVVFCVVAFLELLVSFAGRAFRCLLLFYFGGLLSALPAPHSRLAVLSGNR